MHIWPLCLGMCFVSNVDLQGSGKRVTMPTMLGPVNPRTHSHKQQIPTLLHSHIKLQGSTHHLCRTLSTLDKDCDQVGSVSWSEGMMRWQSAKLNWWPFLGPAWLIFPHTRDIWKYPQFFPIWAFLGPACLINFPTTEKFGNMPSIPNPGRAYHKPICPFDKSVRRTRSFWESGHFLHICGSDDGIIVRIDFWQIEAERAGDTQSYAVPSISKNREKCGRGLVGHGSSIDVIYIGGAQAGGRWCEPNGPFWDILFLPTTPSGGGGGDYQAKTADC